MTRARAAAAPAPRYFPSAAAFALWLRAHHTKATELWVGFHKVGSGRPSLTWPESVDEALCVGWIDGLRKRVDATRYMIRFTPRRPAGNWSAVNVRRVQALVAAGRMRPAGLEAFAARRTDRVGVYSFEQRPAGLPAPYERRLRRDRAAWAFFRACPPSYRRAATWWVVSAKQEATRLRRLEQLIHHSAHERAVPQFLRPVKAVTAGRTGAAKRAGRRPVGGTTAPMRNGAARVPAGTSRAKP
jgi:uncharacterized protein YdeI (YjbR/CyaY-like superfamily)